MISKSVQPREMSESTVITLMMTPMMMPDMMATLKTAFTVRVSTWPPNGASNPGLKSSWIGVCDEACSVELLPARALARLRVGSFLCPVED